VKIVNVTPIQIVERIEPLLALWQNELGFEKLAEVAHEGQLGFVLLARGQRQVMLQSRRSLADDLPAVAARAPSAVLYLDVESLDEALPDLKGLEVLAGPRTTFYGAREVFVLDPAGQVLGFAEHVPAQASTPGAP
jgi:hypothetical protein